MSNQADLQSIREWFSPENYQANVNFNAAKWAAQIYRRFMIQQSVDSTDSTAGFSQSLIARIEGLQTDPLGVPDWVEHGCGRQDAVPSVHPLTFGDIRDMLGYWRAQFGYDEPEETPPLYDNNEEQNGNDHEQSESNNEEEHDDSYKAPPVDSDSSELIWNALPNENRISCDGLFLNPGTWDAPDTAHVAIDIHAPIEQLKEELGNYVTQLQQRFNLDKPLAPKLGKFYDEKHPWVKNRVLEYFDIDMFCKLKGWQTPEGERLLDLFWDEPGEAKRANTISKASKNAITRAHWRSLIAHISAP